MTKATMLVMAATLIIFPFGAACAQEEEEPNPDVNILGEYLLEMSQKLECYFTIEDRPDAQGAMPWIPYLKGVFTPDLEVATIDALVTKLNQEIEDVKFQRSTKYPSVVHVIAKDLLVEGYVMDQQVSTQYSGTAHKLSGHLGTLLDGKITSRIGFPIGLTPDLQSEVEVNVQNEAVRDILTGAIPLEGAYGTLWEAQRRQVNGMPRMEIFFHAAPEEE